VPDNPVDQQTIVAEESTPLLDEESAVTKIIFIIFAKE
jgi:hypothetical protein